jgi:hypothetical protein
MARQPVSHALLAFGLALMANNPVLAAEPATAKPSPLDRLRYFLGTWVGEGHGQPGNSTVEREYRLILGDRFIEARSQSTYAPQEKNPKGEVHEDRGIFSWDRARGRFVLRQFHVEGFVNHYVADSLDAIADSLVFTSEAIENIPSGFRARETYRMAGPDEFLERFEMAEPGGAFALYSETRFKRKP